MSPRVNRQEAEPPSLRRPRSGAEGHIYILLAGQLPSDATLVQTVSGDGADPGSE